MTLDDDFDDTALEGLTPMTVAGKDYAVASALPLWGWIVALDALNSIAADAATDEHGTPFVPAAEREAARVCWHFVKRARDAHHPPTPNTGDFA